MSKIRDERLLTEQRKIYSDACWVFSAMLLLSVVVQAYIMRAPFAQYAFEFFIFLAGMLYILVRNILAGNSEYSLKGKAWRGALLNGFICSATVTVINGIIRYQDFFANSMTLNMGNFALTVLVTFISCFITVFAVFFIVGYFSDKRRKRLESELDNEE